MFSGASFVGVGLSIAIAVGCGPVESEPQSFAEALETVDSLRDLRGNRRSIDEFNGSATVFAFLGTDCPLAKRYIPKLNALEARYRSHGVRFVAVFSNQHETVDDIAAMVDDHDLALGVVKDFGGRLASVVGATRTPEVCLLDQQNTLVYRGRIDDQYRVATSKPTVTSDDLAEALDSLLSGEAVARREVPADGCPLQTRPIDVRGPKPVPSFAQDVLPILQKRCQSCHRPGRSAPFSLLSYEDAVRWSDSLREVVVERRMPPWQADARYGSFHNDRRMSEAEVTTIQEWVQAECPPGNLAEAPPNPDWAEGWSIGEPDAVFTMTADAQIPADGVLPYRYYTISTDFEKDRWIRLAEAKPGNPEVVHHIIAYIIAPGATQVVDPRDEGQILVAWAPGDMPLMSPPGTALRLPKGSELVFEMHYTPNGRETTDRSSVGVVFADSPPEREIRTNLFANYGIRIPAGSPHHRESKTFTFEKDSRLLSLSPHMHWRGKSFRYDLETPDGQRTTILSVPRWDFNWQTSYWFEKPLELPAGSRIHAVATWDNSAFNLANPNSEVEVRWGHQTWEEMMVGWLQYVVDEPIAPPSDGSTPAWIVALFRTLDRNRDGRLTADEIPTRYRQLLNQIGVDLESGLTLLGFELILTNGGLR